MTTRCASWPRPRSTASTPSSPPYWAATSAPKSWGLEGIENASAWSVLFFNKKLQDGYKAWVKELYTRPNPYDGGLPLSQEPAVGIIQIQNEDGLFF